MGIFFFCFFLKLSRLSTDGKTNKKYSRSIKMLSLKLKDTATPASKRMRQLQQKILGSIGVQESELRELFAVNSFDADLVGSKNCENLIGSVEVPVGLAGPLKAEVGFIGFNSEKKEKLILFLPLATTEGALVASVNRGCKVLSEAGSLKIQVKKVGMSRAPVFGFDDMSEAVGFVEWLEEDGRFDQIKKVCEKTSSHLKLQNFQTWQVGRSVFVRFVFDTDQAMGMNMVTIALDNLWKKMLKSYPDIKLISLSGNMCVDKKSSALNRLLGRGYEVQAEAVLSAEVLETILKTNSDIFFQTYYWKNVVGSNTAGSLNLNMHAANMVAAVFLATGQDMAHVVESSQGSLYVEKQGGGDLYLTLRMPNLNLGTVGGGTSLPAFSQARNLILQAAGQFQKVESRHLAAAVAGTVLAGEISGLAALSSNSLAGAHQTLARGEVKK